MTAVARRCADAIRRAGGEAVLAREDVRVRFAASIQPQLRDREEAGDALGVGAPELYTMYVPWDGAGHALQPGDAVEFRADSYRVQRVETFCLSGEPVYRWAVVRRETGEGL